MEQTQKSARIEPAATALGMSVEDLTTKLTGMGLEPSDFDDDQIFKFSDFRETLAEKPIASVRKAYRALRGGKGPAENESRAAKLQSLGIGYKVKLKDADLTTLVDLYDITKPNDPVSVALKERFGDAAVIVVNDEGKVEKEATVNCMADMEQGLPVPDAVMVGTCLYQTYKVGEQPNLMLDEDPLFPGRPLSNSGRSFENHRNWVSVPLEQRQLVRIIVERRDINPKDHQAVLGLMHLVQITSTALAEAYPQAAMEFRQRKKAGTLPTLRINLAQARKNNPFGVNTKY